MRGWKEQGRRKEERKTGGREKGRNVCTPGATSAVITGSVSPKKTQI